MILDIDLDPIPKIGFPKIYYKRSYVWLIGRVRWGSLCVDRGMGRPIPLMDWLGDR